MACGLWSYKLAEGLLSHLYPASEAREIVALGMLRCRMLGWQRNAPPA